MTDAVSNLIAVGAWTIHRVDGSSNPRISGTRSVALINGGCPLEPGSCYISNSPDEVWVQKANTTLPEGATRKFLIAHEVGHFFDDVYSGNSLADSDAWDLQGPTPTINHNRCSSVGVVGDHALRSEEWASGAFVEGFAHFISTLAFNNHTEQGASFKYYKNDSGLGFSYNFDTVDVENGASWFHSTTGCDCRNGSPGCPERSTELDWLRFFGISAPTPAPTSPRTATSSRC